MDLQTWMTIAETDPNKPLPPEVRAAIAAAVAEIERLALSRRFAPDRAAIRMAKTAGLTAGAIEAFRTQQAALAATMVIEFNRHQPGHAKIETMEQELADNFGVKPRQIRRWRQRVMKKDI